MKKRLSLLLIILLIFPLTACAVNSVKPESSETQQADEQIAQAEIEDTPDEQETTGPVAEESTTVIEEANDNHMKLQIGEYIFTATLADNSSAAALKDLLEEGPLTIDMRDYASMEKVGSLGTSLPTNNEQITTESGDLILYQGNAFVIYYAPNSWNFTRLGKINDVPQEELKQALGTGSVQVTLSLN